MTETEASSHSLGEHEKGWPSGAGGLSFSEVRARAFDVHDDLSTPVAVLDEEALDHNIGRMARWGAEAGIELWPHAKTTMAPAIVARQLGAGADGVTVANVRQLRVLMAHGTRRAIIANSVIQEADVRELRDLRQAHPGSEVMSFVDSLDALRALEDISSGMPFQVLVELGIQGGRGGVRSAPELQELVAAAEESDRLNLAGIAGFEGPLGGGRGLATLGALTGYLERFADAVDSTLRRSATRPLVASLGGGIFFDVIRDELTGRWSDEEVRVGVRSGCYVTHDHGMYEQLSALGSGRDADPLRAALTVWGTVLSNPEPGLLVLDVGRRDISFDQALPTVLAFRGRDGTIQEAAGSEVIRLNDQHAIVTTSSPAKVGDRVQLGVSHPCTTLDRWGVIPLVRGSRVVDAVKMWW